MTKFTDTFAEIDRRYAAVAANIDHWRYQQPFPNYMTDEEETEADRIKGNWQNVVLRAVHEQRMRELEANPGFAHRWEFTDEDVEREVITEVVTDYEIDVCANEDVSHYLRVTDNVREWLEGNMQGRVMTACSENGLEITFELEADLMLFKMRWEGAK